MDNDNQGQGHSDLGSKVKVTSLNPLITCVLCGGYFVDATAITECLHAFCRSCIVSYLELSNYCPICDVQVHDTHPSLGIRQDNVLQSLVYKLVPGLFSSELKRQADYYMRHPHHWTETANPKHLLEERWDIIADDELISLSLEFQERSHAEKGTSTKRRYLNHIVPKRFLQCPAKFTIQHMKKFISAKLSLSAKCSVEVYHTDEQLADTLTLMDAIYIYSWQKLAPFRLYYTVYEVITISSATASSMTSSGKFMTSSVDLTSQDQIMTSSPTLMTSSVDLTSQDPKMASSGIFMTSSLDMTMSVSIPSSKKSSLKTPSSVKAIMISSNASSSPSITKSNKSKSIQTSSGSIASSESCVLISSSSCHTISGSSSNQTPSPIKSWQNTQPAPVSPIYPMQYYSSSSDSDDSDGSDPTFRPERLYAPTQKKRKRGRPAKTRATNNKRPRGLPDVDFYPRYTSTPKSADVEGPKTTKVSTHNRFSPGYVPVYKRSKHNEKLLNTAMLSSRPVNTHAQHNPADVYNFDSNGEMSHRPFPEVKRKRGRPRKYPPSNNTRTVHTTGSTISPIRRPTQVSGLKRGRGRPRKYLPDRPASGGIIMPRVTSQTEWQTTTPPSGRTMGYVNYLRYGHTARCALKFGNAAEHSKSQSRSNFNRSASEKANSQSVPRLDTHKPQPSTSTSDNDKLDVSKIKWLPTSNPTRFIPCIPVSLNIKGIELVKKEPSNLNDSQSALLNFDHDDTNSSQSEASSHHPSSGSDSSDDDDDVTANDVNDELSTSYTSQSSLSTSYSSDSDRNIADTSLDIKPDITVFQNSKSLCLTTSPVSDPFSSQMQRHAISENVSVSSKNNATYVISTTDSHKGDINANIMDEMSPEKGKHTTVSNCFTKGAKRSNVDQSSNVDMAIKQEVEEAHPNLRNIMESRLLGHRKTEKQTEGHDQRPKLPCKRNCFDNAMGWDIRMSSHLRKIDIIPRRRDRDGGAIRFQALN